MKRMFCLLILATALIVSAADGYAQNKNTQNQNRSNKGKNAKNTPQKTEPVNIQLPAYSNDCLFAIELQPDVEYGPTTAPQGAGRIQEIMRDKSNPNIFEYEHNSVWYKFTVPYSGNLEIEITPNSEWDDYDFCVFKYTDVYFSNHLIQNKIRPLASDLSRKDTTGMAAATPKNSKGQVVAKPRSKRQTKATLGMKADGKKNFIGINDDPAFLKSVPVKKGETYYIVLDNKSGNGDGHTIKVSIQVESYEPWVLFYDPVLKRNVDVDLLILEKNTDNRPIVKNASFKGSKVKMVPGFTYSLYAKRDGYFPIYKEFNSNIFKEDTLMRFNLNRTEKGTVFPVTDIYFDDDGNLLPESEPSLTNYMQMFNSYPEITIQVKGYVQSYAVDIEAEQKLSVARAKSVKDFFVQHGMPAENITITGMTQNEIKRAAAAALNKHQAFKDTKVDLIITGLNK
ncbi:MAG: OmpA family protein [Bacteroidales bacterium]|nr:OmpA family protein [Bacteroidales bacterium]